MNNFTVKTAKNIKKIAIFASGSGTNAENISHYFKNSETAIISLILTNKSDAYVIKRAENLNIPVKIFNRDDFYNTSKVLDCLVENEIDLIVLAGFLWLIPENITRSFSNRIINIHPALLPEFGGKGMYGDFVHKKVIECGKTESGITIHYVNEKYDDGNIIFQAKCEVTKSDTSESLACKIHKLEYDNYPRVIESIINGQL
jgi:phosphoribosylglycinamide formyltransferase-1